VTVETMPALCTQAAVEQCLSVNGVVAFSDHDADGLQDEGVVEDAIQRASDEIHLYLHDRYNPADLAACALVNRWAVVGAAVYLCQTRNNPPPESLRDMWDKLMAPDGLIQQIGAGIHGLPGVQLRYDSRPSFSNLRIDRRWPTSKTRVTTVNSSDSPTVLTQDAAIEHAGFDL
jgi:phage gp36-like protein